MKKYSLFLFALILKYASVNGQDALSIMRKADAFCKTIQWGNYEMEVAFKGLMSTDTSVTKYHCKYSKLEADSISPVSFIAERIQQNKLTHTYIYSGEDFIYLFARDSTGSILNKNAWPAETKKAIKEGDLYKPLTAGAQPLFYSEQDFSDTTIAFIRETDKQINGIDCYHIGVTDKSQTNTMGFKVSRVAFEFWIRKDTYLPIQYTVVVDMMNGNVPMQQYTCYSLQQYSFNWPGTKKVYDISDAPPYYRLKNYEPFQRKDPLANGKMAPELEGKDIHGKKIKLKDFRGKAVLIDFFYMACAPCILSFPHIKELYRKYADSGLVVLGVNPVDKKKEQLSAFFQKYEIQYPVIIPDDATVTADYIVQGYPCFYLVDKDGKIAFSLSGYGQGVEKLIEENIRKLIR